MKTLEIKIIFLAGLLLVWQAQAFANRDFNLVLIKDFEIDINLYKLTYGHYPAECTVFEELDKLDSSKEPHNAINHKSKSIDLWGSQLIYRYPSNIDNCDYNLYSIGKNKVDEKGKGDDISICYSLKNR